MKQITLGVVAHVDAGKTTLSEAMLYRCGVIRRLGRVDHGDAFFDTDVVERDRGITVFSKQAVMEYGGCRMTLIDTPGHVDFSAEAERCLSVLDYAVLIISGPSGVQEAAERYRAENGSIICRELLGLSQDGKKVDPAPRTQEYYKKRPCPELVAMAARIADDYIAAHPVGR